MMLTHDRHGDVEERWSMPSTSVKQVVGVIDLSLSSDESDIDMMLSSAEFEDNIVDNCAGLPHDKCRKPLTKLTAFPQSGKKWGVDTLMRCEKCWQAHKTSLLQVVKAPKNPAKKVKKMKKMFCTKCKGDDHINKDCFLHKGVCLLTVFVSVQPTHTLFHD